MPKHARKITCEEFRRLLGELTSSGADPSAHPHVQGCANCRQLTDELAVIAEEARKLLALERPEVKQWPD